MSEQLKGITERTEEEPQPAPPHPPLVVDHQRLAVNISINQLFSPFIYVSVHAFLGLKAALVKGHGLASYQYSVETKESTRVNNTK